MAKNAKPKASTKRLAELAFSALKEAVADVIKEHRRNGQPLVVYKNGKIVSLDPRKLPRRR